MTLRARDIYPRLTPEGVKEFLEKYNWKIVGLRVPEWGEWFITSGSSKVSASKPPCSSHTHPERLILRKRDEG